MVLPLAKEGNCSKKRRRSNYRWTFAEVSEVGFAGYLLWPQRSKKGQLENFQRMFHIEHGDVEVRQIMSMDM